jgi:hypothetical protein
VDAVVTALHPATVFALLDSVRKDDRVPRVGTA